jgi:hypothetical protein
MADAQDDKIVSAREISDISNANKENKCECCHKLKQELKVKLQENNKKKKKIVQLLQEDVNSMSRQNTVSTNEDSMNHHFEFEMAKYNYKRWNLVCQ